MDAWNDGLCALEPNRHEYLRYQFTDEDRALFSIEHDSHRINIRELRSAVPATLVWGNEWKSPDGAPVHVCFHITNTSAAAWANRRTSRHSEAQLYLRLLSLAKFQYNVTFSANHIPGHLNT